jgi:hypothetical protein
MNMHFSSISVSNPAISACVLRNVTFHRRPLFHGMAIPRELQPAFDWTCDETDSHLFITFSFPPAYDLSTVRSRLYKVDSKSCISVTLPDGPYLLHGILTGDAQLATLDPRESDHSVVLSIAKSSPGRWKLPVKFPLHTLTGIDPKSAFQIAQLVLQSHQSLEDRAIELLQHSANCGFLPALRQLGDAYLGSDETFDAGISLLMVAANNYGDDYARCKLAMVHILDGENADNYFQFLARAASQGVVAAHLFLGQLLSPFSEFPWDSKSGIEAKRHLELAVAGEPGPDALAELAKLLHEGCEGVPANRERAARLHRQACELALLEGRQLPPLGGARRGGGSGRASALLISLAAAAVVVASFLVIRRRR